MKPSRTLDMLVVLACMAVTTGLAVVFGSHQGHSRDYRTLRSQTASEMSMTTLH